MAQAFQDGMARNLCFGCGAANELGLQLKSFWDGDEAVCHFQPEPYHMAGPTHVVNGGIVSTIIDCHSVCMAVADAYHRVGRDIGSDPMIWYATGSLKVDFLKPTPIDRPIELRAQIVERTDKRTRVSCTCISSSQKTALGDILAVRVPTEWFTGR